MSQVQITNETYKEWLDTSIREGCPESDLIADPIHVGQDSYGIVQEVIAKRFGIITRTILNKKRNVLSGMTAAVKTLFSNKHGCKKICTDNLSKRFVLVTA